VNERELTHVDLFAGIGGFSFAFEAEGFRTVAYSEINPDKCLVYDHWFPGVRNLGDIKGITRNEVGRVDVLTGGVPCQPASALGQMRGTADERWLWPEATRLVRLFRPRYGVFENPPSLLILEGGRAWNGIVSGLVASGFDCWWDVFPAAAFGAGHLRERVLLVIADAMRIGREQTGRHSDGSKESPAICSPEGFTAKSDGGGRGTGPAESSEQAGAVDRDNVSPHADRAGLQGHAGHGADGEGRAGSGRPVAPPDLRGRCHNGNGHCPWWHEINTGVPVLAHGLPARLVEAAARCAGDAVVPQVIQPIARAIKQMLT
jgi:DNA (cytosine-5)-methyltransferase 1